LTLVIVLKGGETVPIDKATDEQIASALAFVKKQE
jgi:hypothetical protein